MASDSCQNNLLSNTENEFSDNNVMQAQIINNTLNSNSQHLSTSESPKGNTEADCNKAKVDPLLLESLINMGMDKNLSKKALICTKNVSIEVALTWIAELGAEEMEALCYENDKSSDCSSEWEDCEDVYYKMVFVVNTEYGMGAGKVASQVGHAALGLYRILKDDREKYQSSLEEWEETGEKKITLRAQNSVELLKLQTNAEKKDLPTYIVADAGKTQIPEGSITVLGIFGDEDTVNDVTGHLKLL